MDISIILTGFAAGAVNGLFSTGGGTVVVFALTVLLKKEYDTKAVFATVNALIAILSAVSLAGIIILSPEKAEPLLEGKYLRLIPAAVIGAGVGAVSLKRINRNLLTKIFALLIIYCGIRSVVC